MSAATTFVLPEMYQKEDSWGPPMQDEKPFGFAVNIAATKAWDKFAPRIVDAREERAAVVEKAQDNAKRGEHRVENMAKVDALAKVKSDAEGDAVIIRSVFVEGVSRGRGGGGRGGRGGGRGGNVVSSQIHANQFGPVIAIDRSAIQQLQYSALAQATGTGMPATVDQLFVGKTKRYNASIESGQQQSNAQELTKPPAGMIFSRPRTIDDLHIRDIVSEYIKANPTKTHPVLVTTEKALASIMAAPKGRFVWDLEVLTNKQFIFVQERKETAEHVYTEWVEENTLWGKSSSEPTSINYVAAVGQESNAVNRAFAVYCQERAEYTHAGSKKCKFTSDNTKSYTQTMYRYRLFKVGTPNTDDYFEVICRTEIDAVHTTGQNVQFLKVFALLDQVADGSEAASEWKKIIADKGRGALLMNEMKNNAFKIQRWIIQSVLAGAHDMKVAFITRANPKSNEKHVILGVDTKQPVNLASQFQIKIENLWSIVGQVINAIVRAREVIPVGELFIVREIEELNISTYNKPGGDSDESGDDDDDEDDSDSSSSSEDGSSSSSSSSSDADE